MDMFGLREELRMENRKLTSSSAYQCCQTGIFCIFLAYILFFEEHLAYEICQKKLAYFWHIFQFNGKPENSFRKLEISVKQYQILLIFDFFSPNEKIYSSQKLCRKRKNVKKTNFLYKLKKNFHLAYILYFFGIYFIFRSGNTEKESFRENAETIRKKRVKLRLSKMDIHQ